jgi:hypothetical protein
MVRGLGRAALALSAAVCVAAAALAQHEHPAPSLTQSSEPQPGTRYGAEKIPPERLQKPPTPKLPGDPSPPGKPGGPPAPKPPGEPGGKTGGPPTPKPPGDPSPPGKPGGPPAPKPPGGPTPGGKPGGPPAPKPPGGPQPISSDGCEPHSPLPPDQSPVTAAYQQFPPSGDMKTAWLVTFDQQVHRGLYITSAYYKPGPDRDWVKVLSETGPSVVFVPYQTGQPRFDDLSPPSVGGKFNFPMMQGTPMDRGRCGLIIGRGNTVIREVVEKGVLWKWHLDDPKTNRYTPFAYRGHKLTLWGSLIAGNYQYIFSYSFHDDGMIEVRAGATASNFPDFPWRAHMHNVTWRVNLDLGAAPTNVHVMRHLETPKAERWLDCVSPFNGNREGGINWNPTEFTMLHVESTKLRNRRNLPIGYMVMPQYRGQARHLESWMRNDAWVTRYKAQELFFRQIERYAADRESLANTNLTLWLNTSALHIARSEDGLYRRDPTGGTVFMGSAVAMWMGFDLKPFNLGDDTPFLADVVPLVRQLTPILNQNPPALPQCPN